ncbi:hypothetical protein PLICRDRAFT_40364 [Plicaturopsis crispa FD-325 SS-3]|nr:hypothetical protein PLICRDRAFT_40364 [Plicaturopsis crispa FD-325 SS-3]
MSRDHNTVQGATSTTWKAPPLDGSVTVPEMFDFHLQNSPDHPLFVYHNIDGEGATTVTWAQATRAVHRAANLILALTNGHKDGRKTVAILGVADALTYTLLVMGIMRSGHIPFPISPRNSPPIVTHLLNKTSASILFVSPDPAMQSLAAAGSKDINYAGLELHDMPLHEALFPAEDGPVPTPPITQWLAANELALILHSSGSTAYPKPIPIKHLFVLQQGKAPWWGEVDLCGHISALHSLPMFHISGSAQTWWGATSGLILGILPPARPPIIPTPDVVFEGIVKTRSTLIFGVAVHIEIWSRDPAKVEHLKSLRAVMYQGSPLEKNTGEKLLKAGVNVFPVYGGTEMGVLTCLIPDKRVGDEFEWFVFSPHYVPHFVPQEEPGVYELVMIGTERHALNVTNTKIDGKDAYASSDLLAQHPTRPHLWKVYGRADDQITLSSGEKTNPVPLEGLLLKDPLITSALMYGRGKFNVLILVEPKEPFDPTDEGALAEFRNKFWPTVEHVNTFAPSHSRIFKEMILVANPSKPFEYTAKGTPRRQAVFNIYAEEIEAAYATAESTAEQNAEAPEVWDTAQTLAFVKTIFDRILKVELKDDDDIFSYGCDSLQATFIRNSVLLAVRKTKPALARELPENFLYKNPTINALTSYLVQKIGGLSVGEEQSELQQMEALVEELTSNLPTATTPSTTEAPSSGDVILLTGTTGALGANALAELLVRDDVKRVYALNRKSEKALPDRQARSFAERGFDIKLLESSKLVLLEGDTTQPLLGLPAAVYDEIKASITHVIHNAWTVDFNFAIASFKPVLKGLRNLIDLSLQSTAGRIPRFIFVSSIAVFRNYDGALPIPEVPVTDLRSAVGFGYGESKLVAENILNKAHASSSLPVTVVRVGQLSGGKNGVWNTKEWVPALVKSGQLVKSLPALDEPISWLPLDKAATALVEVRNSDVTPLHLVHPKPAELRSIIGVIADGLNVPVVPYEQWLKALEAQKDSSPEHPAVRLLDFFRHLERLPALDVTSIKSVSSSLADPELPQLGEKDVESWLGYWRSVQFIQ